MARRYTVTFTGASAAALDFVEITGGANKVTRLLGFEIAQSTEAQDAEEEQVVLLVNRGEGATTSGSGGTVAVPTPINAGDAAFAGSVETMNTTKMGVGSGTIKRMLRTTMNVRVPYEKWFPPELAPVINGANRITIELEGAPADSITWHGTAYLEEE